jgi:hypothetical protein
MKKSLLALLLLALACPTSLAADPVPATSAPVLALGRASAGANEAVAQDAALNDALRQAVARAVTELTDHAALKGRLEAVAREVLAQAPRFVATYGIQSSGRSPEGITVLAAVTVDRPALEKALAGLGLGRAAAPAAGAPAVLVLVSEETAPEGAPVFWWSEIHGQNSLPVSLVRVLAGGNYKIVDPKSLLGRVPLALRQAVLTEEQALQLGRLAGANLVLLGRVRSYPLPPPPSRETTSPVAQMEALSVAGGQVLATVEETGPVFTSPPGPEAGDKLLAVVETATRRLLEQAAAAVNSTPSANGGLVNLEVGGLRGLADIICFEKAMNALTPLVTDLVRDSLSGGVATYRLRLNGTTGRLAEELKALFPVDIAVSVAEAGPDRLKVSLAPKP